MQTKYKTDLNLLVLGQTNSGRSTVIGQIAFKFPYKTELFHEELPPGNNTISDKIRNYDQLLHYFRDQQEQGKENRLYFGFQTLRHNLIITDAPGHRNFMKNIITGSTNPQIGLLIVSAVEEEFQASISQLGYTIEHFNLANVLGLNELVIAVNKIDHETINFSELKFNNIKQKLQNILNDVGYIPDDIPIIPVSGFTCCNLFEKSINTPWYEGISLIEALNNLEPKTLKERPLRLSLEDIYRIGGIGVVPYGRVLSGIIEPGILLKFPLNKNFVSECATVEMMRADQQAYPGDKCGFNIKGFLQSEFKNPIADVVCDAERDPARIAISFQVQIVVLKQANLFKVGQAFQINCHYANVSCRLETIHFQSDKRTGKIINENPNNIKIDDIIFLTIIPLSRIIVEPYSQYPKLGRFVLKEQKEIVAAGIITNVNKSNI